MNSLSHKNFGVNLQRVLTKNFQNFSNLSGESVKSLKNDPHKFCLMPTPFSLPILGTVPFLLAQGGSPKLHEYIDRRHTKLGPIFKEKIGPVEAVFISDPNLMRTVFANEGRCPKHVLPEPWILYNKVTGVNRGIFFMDGEEWLHFRRILNKYLLRAENQKWIEKCCENSTNQFIGRLNNLLQNQNKIVLTNLEKELYRNSIETIISILLGGEYPKNKEILSGHVKELTEIISSIFEATSKLMLLPATIAQKLNLASWKNFVSAAEKCLFLANSLIGIILEDCPSGNGLLSKLKSENIKPDDIKRIIVDFILAAGDTTAYSSQWALYLLSKYEQVQENLLNDPNLIKGIMKEALRLYPVAPFLTRFLPEDTELNGYIVPKNTLIILSLFTSSRDPNNFKDPLKFWPERWSRSTVNSGYIAANPYASLPFAMGSRSCIGKKIADAQMASIIKKLTENFKMKLASNKKIEMILRLVSVPSNSVDIEISRRNPK